nr:unnamed protein product [Callosobruchus analis]
MRIAVNLSNFFADHRRQARICVNESIQTIGDLQNKISGIFDVHDFYLVCDNAFLPPSEDIQVLQNNDLVWFLATI